MKKLLRILTILFVIGVIASLFIPTITIYAKGIPAPDKGSGARDPHSHVGDLTVCYNITTKACDS